MSIKTLPFTSWVFSVNFGDADLYEKHRFYMQLAYEARDKEVQFYIEQFQTLEKENARLREALESSQKESSKLKLAIEFIQHHANTIEYGREKYIDILKVLQGKK